MVVSLVLFLLLCAGTLAQSIAGGGAFNSIAMELAKTAGRQIPVTLNWSVVERRGEIAIGCPLPRSFPLRSIVDVM